MQRSTRVCSDAASLLGRLSGFMLIGAVCAVEDDTKTRIAREEGERIDEDQY